MHVVELDPAESLRDVVRVEGMDDDAGQVGRNEELGKSVGSGGNDEQP